MILIKILVNLKNTIKQDNKMSVKANNNVTLSEASAQGLIAYLNRYSENGVLTRENGEIVKYQKNGALVEYDKQTTIIHIKKLGNNAKTAGLGNLTEKTKQAFEDALKTATEKAKGEYKLCQKEIVQIKQSDLVSDRNSISKQPLTVTSEEPNSQTPLVVNNGENNHNISNNSRHYVKGKRSLPVQPSSEVIARHKDVIEELKKKFTSNESHSDEASEADDEASEADGEANKEIELSTDEMNVNKRTPQKPRSCFSKALLVGCYTASAFALSAIVKYAPPVLQEARIFIKEGILTEKLSQVAYLNGHEAILECSKSLVSRGIPRADYLHLPLGISIPNPAASTYYPKALDAFETAVDRPTLFLAGTAVLGAALFAGKVLCVKAIRKCRGESPQVNSEKAPNRPAAPTIKKVPSKEEINSDSESQNGSEIDSGDEAQLETED